MRAVLAIFVTVSVTLLAAQAVPAVGQGKSEAKASDTLPRERLICVTTVETGSLISRNRQCHTKAQWDRIAEVARLRGEDFRGGAFATDRQRPPFLGTRE